MNIELGGKAYGKTEKDYIHWANTAFVAPKVVDKEKAYLLSSWNTLGMRQVIRKTTNIFVKVADWNQNGNQGRGEIRASHGGESKRLNQLLLARVERIDSLLAEYNEKHPNQITADVVSGFLADKPLARRDQGKDFVEFTLERLSSDYARNRIGRSRYENGKSCMNIFQTFLRATRQGTYRSDSIYVGDMTPELLDSYISWRREIKQNSDATINHSLTPILKACAYACEMGMMEPAVNARIQDMRIVTKVSLSEEEAEFDGKSLSKEQMAALLEYYKTALNRAERISGNVLLCVSRLRPPCSGCDDPAMETYRLCKERVAEDYDKDKQTAYHTSY